MACVELYNLAGSTFHIVNTSNWTASSLCFCPVEICGKRNSHHSNHTALYPANGGYRGFIYSSSWTQRVGQSDTDVPAQPCSTTDQLPQHLWCDSDCPCFLQCSYHHPHCRSSFGTTRSKTRRGRAHTGRIPGACFP